MSVWRCSCPPDSRLPLKAAKEQQSGLRYQNPLARAFVKIQWDCRCVCRAGNVPFVAADIPVAFPGVGETAFFAGEQPGPAYGFGYRSRPAGEYIGYTWFHLPNRLVAKFAIFAARIARSSLMILWRLI